MIEHDSPPFRPRPPVEPRKRPRFQASIDLVAIPSAVTVSRLFIASTLRRCGALFIEPDLGQVAAELVALSVAKTGPGVVNWPEIHNLNPITVNLVGYDEHFLVEVADVVPYKPATPEEAGFGTGQGSQVVDALARRRGAYPASWGRVVWAELGLYERAAQRVHKQPPALRTTPRTLGRSTRATANCASPEIA